MSTPIACGRRVQALIPTLISGVTWLYNVEQPRTALVRPDGVALPPVSGRRLIFVPDIAQQGAAVVVQVVDTGHDATSERDVLADDELSGIAAALQRIADTDARVDLPAGIRAARIRLARRGHPSLLAALDRYRAGCPVHRRPACGHTRGAEAPCQWFALGFRALLPPPAPAALPATPISTTASLAALGNANARRRDRSARHAITVAHEAIAVLSRRSHRSAASEEMLRVLKLRVAHPGLSLRELAGLHEPPLTKDAYAGRLRRALLLAGRPGDEVTDRPRPRNTAA